jgi:hypothetical protein
LPFDQKQSSATRLDLEYPKVDAAKKKQLEAARAVLAREN